MPDKGKRLDIIIGNLSKDRGFGSKKSEAPMEEEEEPDMSSGLDGAAESLISAVKSGDVSGVKSALQSFFDMCQHGDSEEYGDDEE